MTVTTATKLIWAPGYSRPLSYGFLKGELRPLPQKLGSFQKHQQTNITISNDLKLCSKMQNIKDPFDFSTHIGKHKEIHECIKILCCLLRASQADVILEARIA